MQNAVLNQNPDADFQVYAVWFSMLASDDKSRWTARFMSDPRVVHFWDEDRVIGKWFAEHEGFYIPIAWDAYYLYGPDAHWNEAPSPLVSKGGTIFYKRDQLREDLLALLEQ